MWLGRECEDPRDRITPSLAEATRTGNDVVRLAEHKVLFSKSIS